ncbi:hypothetical protein [Streptomyces sp. UNOC14_S4]|uniref:hypothetical protein n=1 Tax=Streptomyces sp. UNOC14_S4 TaxID=2872340 RepID=UPI001E5C7191|nr:hypothetical protein [Streptomyces sp. UNOC14_S4]MCC3769357.1 hypothetical protein [Streptomyces sp. UNOC14_S4]
MRSTPHSTRRTRLVVAFVALAAVALPASTAVSAASSAAPAAHTAAQVRDVPDITGLYKFNANGFAGTLRILNVSQGQVQADLRFYSIGQDEHLTGTLDSTTGTLTLIRPMGPTASQTYTLYAGGTNTDRLLMFGGYFMENGGPRTGASAEFVWR